MGAAEVATTSAAALRTSGSVMAAVVSDRIAGALWGAFIADAMAMPTHWFYGGEKQVRSEFGGPIDGYTKSRPKMRGSIMNLSNTGGGGRGSDKGSIIAKDGTFDRAHFTERYVEFMTTPGSHNDTYASTAHRMFFANRQQGKPLTECPDNDHHNVDVIDAFDVPVVVALATAQSPDPEAVKSSALATRGLSPQVLRHCELISDILHQLVTSNHPTKETLQQAGLKLGVDIAGAQRSGLKDPVTA